MKILHLIPSMGGGGTERQLAYLCTELVRGGQDVHVALIYGGPNMERLEKSGAVIHRIKCLNNHDPLLIFRISRLISRIKPDLIHTWLTQMDVLGCVAATYAGIPFVMAERSSAQAYNRGWKNKLRKLAGLRASLIISNSDGGRDYWLSAGKGNNGIEIVRNAIPFDEIEGIHSSLNDALVSPDAENMIFAGRYISVKNLPVMLESFRQVLAARPKARAYLFGDGPLKNIIDSFVSRYGLTGRMIVNGYTADLWGMLKAASLFVNLSTHEGNPNTVLEAVACGCPVVVSDIAAHREFLDDESAWFVPSYSSDHSAEVMIAALTDREESGRRAMNAQQSIRHLSPSATAAGYLELYSSLRSGRCDS